MLVSYLPVTMTLLIMLTFSDLGDQFFFSLWLQYLVILHTHEHAHPQLFSSFLI
jgi:hypothetical protein